MTISSVTVSSACKAVICKGGGSDLKTRHAKEHDETALPELHETARERDSCRLKDVQAVSFNTSDVSHRELCIQRFFMFLFRLRLSVKIDTKRMLYGSQSLRGEQYNNDIDYITSTQVSRTYSCSKTHWYRVGTRYRSKPKSAGIREEKKGIATSFLSNRLFT